MDPEALERHLTQLIDDNFPYGSPIPAWLAWELAGSGRVAEVAWQTRTMEDWHPMETQQPDWKRVFYEEMGQGEAHYRFRRVRPRVEAVPGGPGGWKERLRKALVDLDEAALQMAGTHTVSGRGFAAVSEAVSALAEGFERESRPLMAFEIPAKKFDFGEQMVDTVTAAQAQLAQIVDDAARQVLEAHDEAIRMLAGIRG